ncbi:IPTL-CTERM sorting domain-containing protein [Wenzhouxiangella sediminis]|uniref:IPTL-CTERM sorting domain-containing protein n=1 Tax=Wenzhouxiangella sediminis TaxID=1792836 RepID=A0A3E1KB90_9GAMM|nr:IPTL-CTERM sorting domain-containing protein [Wenzhouxiangella sediminis]RFF31768.1 IPTL-CTERM sorting domain-containing protein [Wenzhouxiangella sediminis]
MRIIKLLSLYSLVLFSQVSHAVEAPPGLIPPSLNPGDDFYIIFAGSDTVDGAQTSATYAAYAANVKSNDPDTDSVNGWITLFGHDDSTLVTQSAFPDPQLPIYNTNGDRVADNVAGLFSVAHYNAIGYDESGTAASSFIWTGFNSGGFPTLVGDDSLGGNDAQTDGCLVGSPDEPNILWATSTLAGSSGCTGASYGLYVVSPVLSVPAPVISIAPGTLDFGELALGSTSGEITVTLSNSGNTDWDISTIEAATAPFAATGGSCGPTPITIAVGGACTLTFTFTPDARGETSQMLSIVSNAPSSPSTLTLQGIGLSGLSVPTLNQYAMLLLALMIFGMAGLTMRRSA